MYAVRGDMGFGEIIHRPLVAARITTGIIIVLRYLAPFIL